MMRYPLAIHKKYMEAETEHLIADYRSVDSGIGAWIPCFPVTVCWRRQKSLMLENYFIKYL